ncbi:rod shape-determining protein RodA [Ignavibacteria bacterium]|nr:rod shape-determining protein RodA [Bacteroidota bacterium]MCZ2102424.1 rod shape-determining protein RodA [Chitinophagales bacterium]
MEYTVADSADITPHSEHWSNYFDWGVFLVCCMLVAVGLISIYSATYDASMSEYFTKQLMYSAIGLVFMLTIAFLPERWIYNLAYPSYGLAIVLLGLVLAIGKTVYGQKNWLVIGSFSFQPSELAKIITVLAVARFLTHRGRNIRTLRDLGITLLLIVLPMGLILVEDTGSASVFAAITVGVMLWAGMDIFILFTLAAIPVIVVLSFFGQTWYYASAGIFSAAAVVFRRGIIGTLIAAGLFFGAGFASSFAYNNLLKPYQKDRVQILLNPDADPRGKGYNVIQSIMAVGSGGLFGKGFLHGTQTQLRYIPKQWTDFIFCVPTEEFGFVGGVIVLGLLGMLIVRIIDVAADSHSKFASMTSAGVAVIFFYHTAVNIGMAIGVFPVMGIPLPFISAGGTSLVVNMGMVGLVLNDYRSKRLKSRRQ